MVERRENFESFRVVRTAFDSKRALPDCREHPFERNFVREMFGQSKPLQTRACEYHSIPIRFEHFANSSRNIATNIYYIEIGPLAEKLCLAADASGCDSCTVGQIHQSRVFIFR